MREVKPMRKTVHLKNEPRVAPPPPDESWDFVDIKGAAALGFVSAATIRRKLTLGELTRYKFFSRTLIRKSEVLEKIQKAQS
jgi:hypothetical protein